MAADESKLKKQMAGDGAEKMTYRVHRLDPTSPDLLFLAGKYSTLSLRALMIDPASFGVAYATEAAFSPAEWVKRITRPNIHVFICVAHPLDQPEKAYRIENGAWVGMITEIGPTPKETFWLKTSGAPEPLADQFETHWHQTATWVDPAHRGRHLAQQLIEAAVSFAMSITGPMRQTRLRAFITPGNVPSEQLYTKAGFSNVGLCTIPEAMAANGNADFPFHGRTDWPAEVLNARVGAIMEKAISKQHG